ncbi:unnamed protein product [Phyllotreta striolata]|uniref:Transcription factor IIIC 90kDa subunit N-terminal domain-containing protein n=1 Tax=Phyllotreta striolata TaxID=444603 RepID=A0A9N9TXR2_PHYSR|nr:unnamed protein product [Phyllotreta striolata]
MNVQLKLLDHFKLSDSVSLNFACGYSEDNRFFIINDIGVYVLGFTGSVTDESPGFLCTKHFFQPSPFTPCSHVEIDLNSFHNELSKEDVYEMAMKTEYSATLKYTKAIEPAATYAEWSPKGLLNKHECLIAVLTNMFSLEIYARILNEREEIQYIFVSNITEAIIHAQKHNWKDANRFGIVTKSEEYKRRIDSVTPTAFTWSHLFRINNENSAVIFCGHINGDITVWRIHNEDFKVGLILIPTFLGRYRTRLKRISTMFWQHNSHYGGALFISDLDGKLNAIHVSNLNDTLACFNAEESFLTRCDKMKIDKISVMRHKNYTFVLVVKQRMLSIYGFDADGELFDCRSEYIEDYYITGLYHVDDKIFVLSLPGIFAELRLEVNQKKITVKKSLISLKNDMMKYRTHGFFFSKNMVLCTIIAYPWDLQSFTKSSRNHVSIFVYHDVLKKPIDILWHNEEDSIMDYWDCFEALRMLCIKEKRFPWLGLPSHLNYDTLSLTQLKTLRLIAKLSEMVFNLIPYIKSYTMKPYILVHYLLEIQLIVKRMSRLLHRSKTKRLTDFQMRSISIQNFHLKELIAGDVLAKANVGKTFVEDIASAMRIANELEYPEPLVCAWCGDKVFAATCLPPHSDSRCCFTMMPVFIIPEYKCPYCKSTAHKNVEEELSEVVCPYCDVFMDKLHVNDDGIKRNCERFQRTLSELKLSDCFEDCLQETTSLEEIEDNTTDYVIFSDDEEEIDTIRKLYERFSSIQVNELRQNDSD